MVRKDSVRKVEKAGQGLRRIRHTLPEQKRPYRSINTKSLKVREMQGELEKDILGKVSGENIRSCRCDASSRPPKSHVREHVTNIQRQTWNLYN